MPIKLLIIDDESIIRKGIRHYINWSQHDVEVVGEASNGELGLKSALALQPDIIVSDIRMPIMDGITMAQEVKKMMPKVKIILLSGYNDKEYLFSAIKLNAFDFVMKSANSADVVEAVLKAKGEILQERKDHLIQQESAKLLENNYTVLRQGLLHNLLVGNAGASSALELNELLDVHFPEPCYVLVYVDLPLEQQLSFVQSAIYILRAQHAFFEIVHQNQLWGILNVAQNTNPHDVLTPLLQEIMQQHVLKILHTALLDDLSEIPSAHKRMLVQAQRLCWREENTVIALDEQFQPPLLSLDILLRLEDECLNAFNQQNKLFFEECILQFQEVAKVHQLPVAILKDSVSRIVATMYRARDRYEDAGPTLQKIQNTREISVIFALLKTSVELQNETELFTATVRHAMEYIQENYTEQITLTNIANFCYVSPAHLSKIFKEEVGTGVVDYMRTLRVEKAKELLQDTNLKIQEVAMRVGYNHYKHFSVCFLQVTGLSPTAYRQNAIKDFNKE